MGYVLMQMQRQRRTRWRKTTYLAPIPASPIYASILMLSFGDFFVIGIFDSMILRGAMEENRMIMKKDRTVVVEDRQPQREV